VIQDPEPAEAGQELLALLRQALHLGLEAARVHGSPIVPFAVTESEGRRATEVFLAGEGSLAECLQLMEQRAPLLSFENESVAVVYDGELETPEGSGSAVFAEGFRQGMGTSVTLAQRYVRRGRRRMKIRRVGQAMALEQGRHFIR
jgi:hypothetical protein